MEIKAYVFANKTNNNSEYGWIYMFVPGICSETDLTIELIEHQSFEMFSYSKSALKEHRDGFRKCDLVPVPPELYREFYTLIYSGDDESDKISTLTEDIIAAHQLMEQF